MSKITFVFEADNLPERTFEGDVKVEKGGDVTVDGTVVATPLGKDGVYILTEASGTMFGQRAAIGAVEQ